MSLLNKNDIILFKGSYNKDAGSISGPILAFPVQIDANPNGTNIMPVNYFYYYLKDSTTKYVSESYQIASYGSDGKTKIGEISFEATYPDQSQSGVSSPGTEKFIVTGKSGIYLKICDVLIDFTNNTRVISFVGRKQT